MGKSLFVIEGEMVKVRGKTLLSWWLFTLEENKTKSLSMLQFCFDKGNQKYIVDFIPSHLFSKWQSFLDIVFVKFVKLRINCYYVLYR